MSKVFKITNIGPERSTAYLFAAAPDKNAERVRDNIHKAVCEATLLQAREAESSLAMLGVTVDNTTCGCCTAIHLEEVARSLYFRPCKKHREENQWPEEIKIARPASDFFRWSKYCS